LLRPIKQLIDRLRMAQFKAIADPRKLIWIDPAQISRYSCLPLTKHAGALVCEVIAGDWDINSLPLSGHTTYQGLHQHFLEGVDWKDTKLFRTAGYAYLKSTNNLDEKLRQRDALFASIREHGVLPSFVPEQHDRETYNEGGVKNIGVLIGRDGELIFSCRGWHRLCISKILKLSRIPVQVLARHTDWQRIREEIAASGGRLRDLARKPLHHPDLADLVPPPHDGR
jgi:hypothetical protein